MMMMMMMKVADGERVGSADEHSLPPPEFAVS